MMLSMDPSWRVVGWSGSWRSVYQQYGVQLMMEHGHGGMQAMLYARKGLVNLIDGLDLDQL